MALAASDPAAAELVACECVVLAETKDHADWELIGQCAKTLEGEEAQALQQAYRRSRTRKTNTSITAAAGSRALAAIARNESGAATARRKRGCEDGYRRRESRAATQDGLLSTSRISPLGGNGTHVAPVVPPDGCGLARSRHFPEDESANSEVSLSPRTRGEVRAEPISAKRPADRFPVRSAGAS